MNSTETSQLRATVESLNKQIKELTSKYSDMRFEIVQEIGDLGQQTVKVEALKVVVSAS